jgi:hypothetical protein
MFRSLVRTARRTRPTRKRMLKLGPWPNGLVLGRTAESVEMKELSRARNLVLMEKGVARTRDGLTKISTGCTGEILQAEDIIVGTNKYTIIVDDDKKIYYDDEGTATAIATLTTGTPYVLGYKGYLVIFEEGCCPKYWDGTTYNAIYDNGTGATNPYQFNNRSGSQDDFIKLGSNDNVKRVAYKFTSISFSAGCTMPPTTFYAVLSKNGNPSGEVKIVIRLTSDSSVLATKTLVADADDLTGDATEYSATFAASDITDNLSPSTNYYASVELNTADAANYVEVYYTTVASGGKAWYYDTDDSSWHQNATADPCFGLKPGNAPNLAFGVVHNSRIRAIEGTSGTNPSYVWRSGANDLFSWSTTSTGGGYTAVIDDDNNSFPVGALAVAFDNLYCFGTPKQPYLAKLVEADNAVDDVIEEVYKTVSAHYRTIVQSANDVFFLHKNGVSSLSTVEQYAGDIQVFSQSENISNEIRENFDSSAIATYVPEWGIYLLQLSGHTYMHALHTQLTAVKAKGLRPQVFCPATEWNLGIEDVTVTGFGHGGSDSDEYCYIGCSNGVLYKFDPSVVEDDENEVTYELWTKYSTTQFGELQVNKINFEVFGEYGGQFRCNFYRNHSREVTTYITVNTPWDTSTPYSDLTMDYEDMGWLIDPERYFDRNSEINITFRALMIGVNNFTLNGKPMYFAGFNLMCNQIGGF